MLYVVSILFNPLFPLMLCKLYIYYYYLLILLEWLFAISHVHVYCVLYYCTVIMHVGGLGGVWFVFNVTRIDYYSCNYRIGLVICFSHMNLHILHAFIYLIFSRNECYNLRAFWRYRILHVVFIYKIIACILY